MSANADLFGRVPKSSRRQRRGGWSWGPVEGAKLRVLSLGLGVQSTTLALMAVHGEIGPMPDCAIVADLMDDEPGWTRETLAFLQSPNVNLPFPVHLVRNGAGLGASLRDRINGNGNRFVTAPFFTFNGGQGRRQCTREFKVEPITRKQRELMGFKPRQRIGKRSCEIWIGISTDEVVRAGSAVDSWAVNRYPLLELRMSRNDCERWLERKGYPKVKKSACVFCPYRSNAEWRDLRDNDPEAFAHACEIDRLVRETPGMKHQNFAHRSLVPLAEADLSGSDPGQGMLEVCEGGCGL